MFFLKKTWQVKFAQSTFCWQLVIAEVLIIDPEILVQVVYQHSCIGNVFIQAFVTEFWSIRVDRESKIIADIRDFDMG